MKPFPRSHPRSLAQSKRIVGRGWRGGGASVPLVNLSERILSSIGGDPWFVVAAAGGHGPGDTRELVGERDSQQIAMCQALAGLLDPGPQGTHGRGGAPLEDDVGGLHKQDSSVLVPRLEILPSLVRSPVNSCFGTRPSQAAKSRPCLKPLPVPIAATTALEMIGPIPRQIMIRWPAASCSERLSISVDRAWTLIEAAPVLIELGDEAQYARREGLGR